MNRTQTNIICSAIALRAVRGIACALVLVFVWIDRAGAHGTAHERIQALTVEIGKSPTNAALRFERGQLLLQHGEFADALKDFDEVRRLAATPPGLDLARANALAGAKRFDEAAALLDRLATNSPPDPRVVLSRARTSDARGRTREAIADYERLLALGGAPQIENFLEPAAALARTDQLDVALAWLDRGEKSLGPTAELALPAIELLLQKNRFDAALARVDAMLKRNPRAASWLALRGDVLQQAGRRDDARKAFNESLAALESLTPTLRRTQANAELERQVREALKQFDNPRKD